MSELRKAMTDQMLLKGFSERTKKSYLDAVSLLARHYHLSPDQLSQSEIQDWFLYLVKERKLSPATCRLYLNAVRFFLPSGIALDRFTTGTDGTEMPTADTGFIVARRNTLDNRKGQPP